MINFHLYCNNKHWFCHENRKKNYPKVYLEQFKFKIKNKKVINFIDVELDLDTNDSDDSNGSNFE